MQTLDTFLYMSTAIQTSKKELHDSNEDEQLVQRKGRSQLIPHCNDQAKAPILAPHKTLTFLTPNQDDGSGQKVTISTIHVNLKLK